LENISLYEQLGIIAIAGLNHFYFGAMFEDGVIVSIAGSIKESLKAFIDNHQSISSPVYDCHIIEIALALILLGNFNEIQYIEAWIENIISRVEFSYVVLKKYYPIDSDSLEDAILLSNTDPSEKENLMRSSTLLVILLQFSAVFRLDSLYKRIYEILNNTFKETTLQIWFPDGSTDESLYIKNAGHSSGSALVFNTLPDSVENMIKLILDSNNKYIDKNLISAIKNDFMVLPLIASRHFRTPILPLYWSIFIETTQYNSEQS
jgi:hypothetical protein